MLYLYIHDRTQSYLRMLMCVVDMCVSMCVFMCTFMSCMLMHYTCMCMYMCIHVRTHVYMPMCVVDQMCVSMCVFICAVRLCLVVPMLMFTCMCVDTQHRASRTAPRTARIWLESECNDQDDRAKLIWVEN